MKKLLSTFFVLSFVFIGLNMMTTSSLVAEERCTRDGDALKVSDTLSAKSFTILGTSTAADNCTGEPDFYKLVGHKIMLCTTDPYNEGVGDDGVSPDFTGCTATLIESSRGSPIVIRPGIETNLLSGAVEDLLIPIGIYPYAVMIASNHLYIKHSESYVQNGSAYTMAGYGPNNASDYSTGTSCYTTDRNSSTPTSSTYSNAATAASGSNGITTIANRKVTSQGVTENVINSSMDDARTLGLACANTIPTTGVERYGYTAEIVDSLNDRNNGADNCDDPGRENCDTTFGNYENYEADFLGVDGSVAFNLLKNDLTIASNRNEATKVAYIVGFNNPVKISEDTVNFKIAVSTSESVSVDSQYDSGEAGNKVQAKKMGANPFGVKFQTKTKRARGNWR